MWSYGIVMWEVMTYGERPYWELSNHEVGRWPGPCLPDRRELVSVDSPKDNTERQGVGCVYMFVHKGAGR